MPPSSRYLRSFARSSGVKLIRRPPEMSRTGTSAGSPESIPRSREEAWYSSPLRALSCRSSCCASAGTMFQSNTLVTTPFGQV